MGHVHVGCPCGSSYYSQVSARFDPCPFCGRRNSRIIPAQGSRSGAPWERWEDDLLREGMSRKKIAARTGRTYAACRQRASTLGVRCIGTWTAEEDAVVRDTSYTLDAAAVELGRPATTVASRAQVLGVRRKKD